jgi:hypothetical protein
MSEKHKSISPWAIQVKNQRKTIGFEEILDVKGDRTNDMWHNVTFPHISICTIRDSADRITENSKSGTKELV